MFNKFKKNEAGQSMVLIALMFTILLGFGALAVDVGNLTYQKSNLQNAADAAALAGVQDLPSATNAENTAINYAKINGKNTDIVTVTTPYKGDKTKIEVVCTRTVSNALARVLGPQFNVTEISARAVAKNNSKWEGQSLPFVNMEEIDLDDPEPVNVWTKLGMGLFESVEKSEVEYVDGNFKIEFSDGIHAKKGELANGPDKIKDNLSILWTNYQAITEEPKYIYCFSFSPDVISRHYVMVDPTKKGDDGKRSFEEAYKLLYPVLGESDNIRLDQLVLIECTWTDYNETAKSITLEYNAMYDLGNSVNGSTSLPDYPIGKFGYSEVGSKKLVE